mmetsp:Transcript_3273/g.6175  ORF Transcript_3273/g.6175 Transcript_3273/m.6175 type:complete len:235 (+) Transcript_3273:2-706(+)
MVYTDGCVGVGIVGSAGTVAGAGALCGVAAILAASALAAAALALVLKASSSSFSICAMTSSAVRISFVLGSTRLICSRTCCRHCRPHCSTKARSSGGNGLARSQSVHWAMVYPPGLGSTAATPLRSDSFCRTKVHRSSWWVASSRAPAVERLWRTHRRRISFCRNGLAWRVVARTSVGWYSWNLVRFRASRTMTSFSSSGKLGTPMPMQTSVTGLMARICWMSKKDWARRALRG